MALLRVCVCVRFTLDPFRRLKVIIGSKVPDFPRLPVTWITQLRECNAEYIN